MGVIPVIQWKVIKCKYLWDQERNKCFTIWVKLEMSILMEREKVKVDLRAGSRSAPQPPIRNLSLIMRQL